MLITVPQHRFLWSPADDHAGHARRYARAELVQSRTSAFKVLRCTSFVSCCFAAADFAVSPQGSRIRFACRVSGSGVVNAMLEMTLSAERAAIRLGATLPFGGSLLLVARREEHAVMPASKQPGIARLLDFPRVYSWFANASVAMRDRPRECRP